MNKYDLGSDPRTGRARMRVVRTGAAGSAAFAVAMRKLPEGTRVKIGEVLCWAWGVQLSRAEMLQEVEVYGPSICLFFASILCFSLLGTVELSYALYDRERPLLAADPLWYGSLAVFGGTAAAALWAIVRDRRHARGR